MSQLEAAELARLTAIIRQWRPVIEAAKAWLVEYQGGDSGVEYPEANLVEATMILLAAEEVK